jgi:hypothetical protein
MAADNMAADIGIQVDNKDSHMPLNNLLPSQLVITAYVCQSNGEACLIELGRINGH